MGRIILKQLNQGGIAPSKYEGRANSVAEMVGLNIHDVPGVISANQALAKETSTTIDAFVKTVVVCSDGKVYGFSSTSGKIWERATDGTWSLVYTTVPAAGGAGCLGAIQYNDHLYWATESRLHRTLIGGAGMWTTDVELDWQTFASTDTEYHPMLVMDNRLYIGDGSNVAQVRYDVVLDTTLFSSQALRILSSQRVKCLGKLSFDLLVGSTVDSNISKSTIYRWNRWSDSWNIEDEIEEVGINAFIPVDNYVLVSAGVNGNIYSYDGRELKLYYQVPGTYNDSSKAVVHPNATVYFQGKPLFGLSTVAGTPTNMGVYSLATKHPDLYPRILNLEFVPSHGKLNTVEIGAMAVRGNDLFVSWKDGSTYGIDKISYAAKRDNVYFISRVMTLDRNQEDNLSRIVIPYVTIPTGCSIELYIKATHASDWTQLTNLVNDTDLKLYVLEETYTGVNFQLKLVLRTSANASPVIESVNITMNAQNGEQ